MLLFSKLSDSSNVGKSTKGHSLSSEEARDTGIVLSPEYAVDVVRSAKREGRGQIQTYGRVRDLGIRVHWNVPCH